MQERQSDGPDRAGTEVLAGAAVAGTGNDEISSARRVARLPAVGPTLISAWRARIALRHVANEARLAWSWWRASREVTNYTYDLTPRNMEQLAAFLAQASGAELSRVQELMRELDADEVLHAHVRRATLASPDYMHADAFPRFGRRIGWYVLVRLFRPRLVVETGVDKGLGACVLCCGAAAQHRGGRAGPLRRDRSQSAGRLAAEGSLHAGREHPVGRLARRARAPRVHRLPAPRQQPLAGARGARVRDRGAAALGRRAGALGQRGRERRALEVRIAHQAPVLLLPGAAARPLLPRRRARADVALS